MRLMHVITGLNRGGAETMLLRLARSLHQRDDVTQRVVSLLGRGAMVQEFEDVGIPVVSLWASTPIGWLSSRQALVEAIDSFQPDVVHSWMYDAFLMSSGALRRARWRSAQVWGIHSCDESGPWVRPRSKFVRALCANRSAAIEVAVSVSERALILHKRRGYHPKRWELIGNGIDAEQFRFSETGRSRIRSELGVNPAALLFGHVGRYDPTKNHLGLLRAAVPLLRELPSAQFMLVGRQVTEENDVLSQFLRGTGVQDRVHLLGERVDTSDIFSAMDVSVSSSISESFPVVLLEAMACERIVVATDVGDSARILGDCGFVASSANTEVLCESMRAAARLVQSGDKRLGARARQRVVEHFSLDGCADRYLQLYADIEARRG